MDRLTEFRDELRHFVHERDWEQFQTPKNLVMALAGEGGELIAEFQCLTPEQSEAVTADTEQRARVQAEIGDVMIYLVGLANRLGIDLVDAARTKLADSGRRYTVEASRGSVAKLKA